MTDALIQDFRAIYTGALTGALVGLALASPFIIWMYASLFSAMREAEKSNRRLRDLESHAFAAALEARHLT